MTISKTTFVQFALSVLLFGFAIGNLDWNKIVNAQTTSPYYAINFGPGANSPAWGAQYVLEVVPGRPDQVLLYQVNSAPFDLSSSDFTVIGNGFPFTVNSYIPNTTNRTFTVSASKP